MNDRPSYTYLEDWKGNYVILNALGGSLPPDLICKRLAEYEEYLSAAVAWAMDADDEDDA